MNQFPLLTSINHFIPIDNHGISGAEYDQHDHGKMKSQGRKPMALSFCERVYHRSIVGTQFEAIAIAAIEG